MRRHPKHSSRESDETSTLNPATATVTEPAPVSQASAQPGDAPATPATGFRRTRDRVSARFRQLAAPVTAHIYIGKPYRKQTDPVADTELEEMLATPSQVSDPERNLRATGPTPKPEPGSQQAGTYMESLCPKGMNWVPNAVGCSPGRFQPEPEESPKRILP